MELELNRSRVTGYESVLNTTVFQEETLETIVPDACPDILRLIDTQGKIFLKSKTAADGRVTLSATARLTVLYRPDDGTGPCRLEVHIPIQMTVEGKGVQPDCFIWAAPRVVSADTRTVNPRKVITRVEIAADVRAFRMTSQPVCTAVTAREGTVEQLTATHRHHCVTAVQEKQISFEDDLTIPAGRPGAEEILHSRVKLTCRETKIIGSKLIFKGDAAVQLLYRPHGGGLDCADFVLPFSQITEVTGVGEEGLPFVEPTLSGAEFVLGQDGRTVSASLSILAHAMVREERQVTLLEDAYSVAAALKSECVPFEYRICQAEGVGRSSVQEVMESGIQIRSVADCFCSVGRLSRSREGGGLRLTAQLSVTAVCVTEEGEWCAISRSFESSCVIEGEEDWDCLFSCRCGELIAAPTADGVEVRFQPEFPFVLTKSVRTTVISEIRVEEQGSDEEEKRPSVVLRITGEGERLWDVAKRYKTTVEDIVKANELAGEQLSGGMLLLIPRKR